MTHSSCRQRARQYRRLARVRRCQKSPAAGSGAGARRRTARSFGKRLVLNGARAAQGNGAQDPALSMHKATNSSIILLPGSGCISTPGDQRRSQRARIGSIIARRNSWPPCFSGRHCVGNDQGRDLLEIALHLRPRPPSAHTPRRLSPAAPVCFADAHPDSDQFVRIAPALPYCCSPS
jgi:hypothetical protein